jgi:hypothetical protein
MSLLGALKQKQTASQTPHIERPQGNRLKLADQLRLRQMERTLQQTSEELKQAKTRIGQLEKSLAEREKQDTAARGNPGQQTQPSLSHLLPIAEISQLAKMAKRFR